MSALRVAFVFASRGLGGAERSMLRLMAHAHPVRFDCSVVGLRRGNTLLSREVEALGVPYYALSPFGAKGWREFFVERAPQVLYLFGRFRTVAAALHARRAGCRCIVSAERSSADRRGDVLARRLDRLWTSGYIANSQRGAENLRTLLGPEGPPVFVVPNGIEWSMRATARADGEPSVLCVGNITRNKGQDVLLEAIRILRGRYPDLTATLVGSDFTGGRFARDAAARGLMEMYSAAGFVRDVRPYLRQATVLVLPSRHREGAPTSILEAMAAGVPVIASAVGGVSELVVDGSTGFLVRPGDPLDLARALGDLLGDASTRTRLATNARRHVEGRFSMTTMVDWHHRAFREAIRASRQADPAQQPTRSGEGGPASVAHVTTAAVSLRYLLSGQLRTLREHGYQVTGISSPGPDSTWLERTAGILHASVAMTRRFTPVADLRSLGRLYRLMRRERFSIVHTHNPKPGLLGQLAARLAGIPIVVNTVHGFYFHEGMHPLVRTFYVWLERVAGLCSDVILSQNEEDVATALQEGIARPGQIRLLGNGIDLARFDPGRVSEQTIRRTRASLGLPANARVVGFVGRLVEEKGLRELLAAARPIVERLPETRFLLVGATDSEKADAVSEALAREMGVEGACVFAGIRQDMPEVYSAMDVFVLPSHREGFPRAPMEAAAMGLPCVVTDIRGCRQTVEHERNGLLVRPGQPDDLWRAILRLLEDPHLSRRLGREGRRRALVEFDERRVFATVLAEYERLLMEKGLSGQIPVLVPTKPALEAAEGR